MFTNVLWLCCSFVKITAFILFFDEVEFYISENIKNSEFFWLVNWALHKFQLNPPHYILKIFLCVKRNPTYFSFML